MTTQGGLWLLGSLTFLTSALINRYTRKELAKTVALLEERREQWSDLVGLLGKSQPDVEEIARQATVELRRQLVVVEMDPDHGDDQETYHTMRWARCTDCHGKTLEEWSKICEGRSCVLERDAIAAMGQECLTGDRPMW